MKVVSNEYKETMNQIIRPSSQFQATLEMIDRSIESDATVTAPVETPFSTGIFDKVHECDYITFERDFFEVGSDLRIAPQTNYLNNGYVSSMMSDENGHFAEIPIIEFSFLHERNFIAMTYQFSTAYPTQIRVTYYLGGEMRGQFISYPNDLNFVDAENHIYDCDRITFEFLGLSKPNHRLRIARLIFGYEKVFGMSDILSVDHTMSVDPISSSLPYEKVSLKVSNQSKDYNPDNPQGTWVHFVNGQPLSIRYGVRIGNATEWVEAGRLILSDAPTVDKDTATFEAVDILSTLTDTYYRGVWNSDGVSLYDLAIDVLEDAGVSNYTVSESLKNIKTHAPIPMAAHRECLQLIANAGCCVLYTSNMGAIVIEDQTYDDTPVDFYLDFEKMFEKPIVKKTEKLKSVDVSVHSLHTAADMTDLCKQENIEVNGVREIQVTYETATDFETEVTGGTLVSATYYARTAFLQISASATVNVVVRGRKIVDDTSIVSVKVDNNGEVCPVNNPLITHGDRARIVGEWVSVYLRVRNSYETNIRQDFALDINDVILIKSDFEENIPARITKLQYKLPGQQGAISVRRAK